MSKAKYRQGKRICSVAEFETCESRWYKFNGKTIHRSFLTSLQYQTLSDAIKSGRLYTAEFIDESEDKE